MTESNGSATTATGKAGNIIHPAAAKWFSNRGISEQTARNCGIYTQGEGAKLTIVYPFIEKGETVNRKYRGKDKHFWQDTGGRKTFFNHAALVHAAEENRFLVITEGENDTLATIEAGYPFVASVPDGAPAPKRVKPGEVPHDEEVDPDQDAKFDFIWNNLETLNKVQGFILAGDNDEPGRVLNHELQRRLGPERCFSIEYPAGCKDLNEVLLKHGAPKIVSMIAEAKPYPVKGLYRLEDFPNRPKPRLYTTGFPCMDKHLVIETGRIMVVTGVPNHGKSAWVDRLCFNLARTYSWHLCIGSFENDPAPGWRDQMRRRYWASDPEHLPEPRKHEADAWINKHFSFICQHPTANEENELSLDDIINLTEISILRHGTRVLVIDPWNEIEHKRRRDEMIDEYIGRAIRQLKRLAKRWDILVIIVAHPTKMSDKGIMREPGLYDINGGAMWSNKADYGVVIWRPDVQKSLTEVKIKKVKFQEYAGCPGVVQLDYNKTTAEFSQYVSDEDFGRAA